LNVLAVMRKDKGSNFARSGACWIIETGTVLLQREFALCYWPRPPSSINFTIRVGLRPPQLSATLLTIKNVPSLARVAAGDFGILDFDPGF
jgi:hypothetical protein